MYKFLLCWRYLRTRWIAFASIVSVTLGVATMIVVNSVMEGFRHEMQDRIHSILSDVVFESTSLTGFYDVQWHMDQIRGVAGEHIDGMSATVVVPAMLSYQFNDRWITRPVQLIGVDEQMQSKMGDLGHYLQHPENRKQLSFNLRPDGYDTRDHQAGPDALERPDMIHAGWEHRRRWVERQRMIESMQPKADREGEPTDPYNETLLPADSVKPTAAFEPYPSTDSKQSAKTLQHYTPPPRSPLRDEEPEKMPPNPLRNRRVQREQNPLAPQFDEGQPSATAPESVEPDPLPMDEEQPTTDMAVAPNKEQSADTDVDPAATDSSVVNPFALEVQQEAQSEYDPAREQLTGVVLGIGLAGYRDHDGRDRFLVLPGDDVKLSFPTAGTPPEIAHPSFTVVDFYESKMSEYDASFVFVPIEALQKLRGMFDPATNIGYASSIQIKLKPGSDGDQVRNLLRSAFVPQLYSIQTWRDKQGPLLAAVQMETAILNVLLFMIIAVAGFGILAIFFMIVVEKTRDIGILKSLGASRRGVQGIFLGYGLLLGLVGAGAGMTLGLLFVAYINEIADLLGMITGQEVFDPAIYYFQSIPTIVQPYTVTWIVTGALAIAVLASVLPARRASRLHPVEALRYE
jgi:lipoprotein-releasing system permease protein